MAARIATDSGVESEVVGKAVALATELAGKNPEVVARHKQLMYGAIAGLIGT